ncbi:hypothetical protein KKF05_01995 [Patescibacteria group bacterium]|nr:hypothetical protein [Patescibacteria group bacterium]MBU1029374.1 hypothetical protein [Patescibacteria group bacterium]MBU1916035.1 hypothetical protein [Patescibacteria group bacterium]
MTKDNDQDEVNSMELIEDIEHAHPEVKLISDIESAHPEIKHLTAPNETEETETKKD